MTDSRVRWNGGTVDGIGMSEATVVDETDVVEEPGYRDRRSLEAELQDIVRSKLEPSPPSGFWAKRNRRKS